MIRRVVTRMSAMCPAAWYIYKRSMQLCLVMLSCGLLLTVGTGGIWQPVRCEQLANAYYEAVQAVLLLGALLPVLIEDQQSRR